MADIRLICANAALNDLCGSQCGCRIDECGLDEPCEKARCIIRQPTIEAEPVKHGKWERHTNFAGNYYTCTVCKNVAREMPECMGEPIYEFCPYCGARMDGGAD